MANKLKNQITKLGLGSLLGDAISEDYDLNSNNGYIRFVNGFQVAWISSDVLVGGTAWSNVYYSDHKLGNWKKPFKSLFLSIPSIGNSTYWVTQTQGGINDSGTIRALRPTAGTATIRVSVVGFGTW